MTTLDRDTLRAIRVKLDAALAAVGQEAGVRLQLGNATFDPEGGTATFKLHLVKPAQPGAPAQSFTDTKARADWDRAAPLFGLQPDWVGQTRQRHDGTDVTILGLMPSRHKYPVLCLVGGRRLVLTKQEIVRLFA